MYYWSSLKLLRKTEVELENGEVQFYPDNWSDPAANLHN